MPFKKITNILFDTSFLLNNSPDIDEIIKTLRRDRIQCFTSSTVLSELEYLYTMGRISREQNNRAVSRYKKAGSKNIEMPYNYLQESMTRECSLSMNSEHGAEPKDVRNDCNILTSGLNNNIDLILSEDFHFTSKYTDRVVDTVCGKTCDRFHKLCECDIILVNRKTFLAAYRQGSINLDIVSEMKPDVRKASKVLK